jgi:hypothetical protein
MSVAEQSLRAGGRRRHITALLVAIVMITASIVESFVDEGGVSFWLPGLFGSLAAVPVEPGPSFAAIYYHSSVASCGSKTFVLGGGVAAGLNARADLGFFGLTYTFETLVLGGQASISLPGVAGHPAVPINATLTGPLGRTISGSRYVDRTAFGVMIPQAALRWNFGVNNVMAYVTGDIPVGACNVNRLANTGLGHGAIDAGGGYTYFGHTTGVSFLPRSSFAFNHAEPAVPDRTPLSKEVNP